MGATRGSGSVNSGGPQSIPAGAREMLQSLKEIVNCSDSEIYAALKECNMDPNEAFHRLLSQDPFHEVKSKREKKKEGKYITESKPCSSSNVSRSGKSGTERYLGRHGSASNNSSECSSFPGKSLNKKENGSSHSSYFSSVPGVAGHGRSRGPNGSSDGFSAESKGSFVGTYHEEKSDFVLPARTSWVSHGQISMADILKMGRSNDDIPNNQSSHHHISRGDLVHPGDHEPEYPYSEISSFQNVQTNEEWPSMKQLAAATVVSAPEWILDTENHVEMSSVLSDKIVPLHESKEVQHLGHYSTEKLRASEILSEPVSGKFSDDCSRDHSLLENNLDRNKSACQHEANSLHEVDEVIESVSSIAQNFQQLDVNKDAQGLLSEGYVTSVVIPDHLQIHGADCSHLSFGSFGAGLSMEQSVAESVPRKVNLEQGLPIEPEISSVGRAGTRISECYDDDSRVNSSNDGLFHGTVEGSRKCDQPPVSQTNTSKHESAGLAHGNQYSFPSANPGFKFDDFHHSNTTPSQTSSQMQELASFSNVMPHAESLQGILPSASVQPTKESGVRYPFSSTQLMPDKYGTSVSSVGISAIAPEALTMAGVSAVEPALSSTAQPPFPQHPSMQPYSPPSLPMGPFANMLTYPSYLPQSYTRMPPAFQQAFNGNGVHPQSLAGVLSQYKNPDSSGSLHQSAAVTPGHGELGNSTSIPVNFPTNPTAVPSASNLNIDDALLSLLLNGNPALWLQGPNSRTMPAVPSNSYYGYQAKQLPGGFRQPQQQPSPNYAGVGFGIPNHYNSQLGLSPEQQSHSGRDIAFRGSQAQPKQPHPWQDGGY